MKKYRKEKKITHSDESYVTRCLTGRKGRPSLFEDSGFTVHLRINQGVREYMFEDPEGMISDLVTPNHGPDASRAQINLMTARLESFEGRIEALESAFVSRISFAAHTQGEQVGTCT
jgi:hypothetical protein